MNDSTWTWVSGSNIVNQPGIYGVKGIPNSNNQPGAREGALGLYDSLRQVLWLFGGYGYDNTSEGSWLLALHQTIHQKNIHLLML